MEPKIIFDEALKLRKLKENMSCEEYEDYFKDFDPLKRDWKTAPNPDDYDSALKLFFKDFLKENEVSIDDLANIISNAYWNGHSTGFSSAEKLFSN